MIEFFVPGKPVAKQRARTVTRGKGGKPLPFARTYTPKETASYENLVKVTASQAMNGKEIMSGPLRLTLIFYLPMPSSWSEKRKDEALRGEIRATKKPDLDNLEKSIKDGCNKVVWNDDSQVVSVSKDKIYSRDHIGAYVAVRSAGGRSAP